MKLKYKSKIIDLEHSHKYDKLYGVCIGSVQRIDGLLFKKGLDRLTRNVYNKDRQIYLLV